ncbi:MAG: YggT family protein [Nitrospirae bacterium]|nr:YggT family protein [Nitrospirota bacterium]
MHGFKLYIISLIKHILKKFRKVLLKMSSIDFSILVSLYLLNILQMT